MRTFIKNFTYIVLYGIRNFLNFFYAFKEASVLSYHSISDDDWELSVSQEIFEKQISFLKKKGYHFVNLDEIISCIKTGDNVFQKMIAITFDDGYEDVYTNAFPILSKYNIPATVFIFPNSSSNKKFLKENSKQLSTNQISEMKESGLISFGHHSATHSLLETLSDDDLNKELNNEGKYSYFAYPGGHYSSKVIHVVKANGFIGAFSIKPGLITKKNDLFLIKRNVILKNMPFWQFKLRTTKAIDWYRGIVRLFR